MRKFLLAYLTVATTIGGTSFAVATQPVQPASVQPMGAQQVEYVYDDGEDYDNANAAANETKQMEQARESAEPAPEAESSDPVLGSSVDSSSCDSCNGCGCDESGWCSCIDGFSLDEALGWGCCPYNLGGWTNPGYPTNNEPLS